MREKPSFCYLVAAITFNSWIASINGKMCFFCGRISIGQVQASECHILMPKALQKIHSQKTTTTNYNLRLWIKLTTWLNYRLIGEMTFYILIINENVLFLCEKWLSKFLSNLYVLRPPYSMLKLKKIQYLNSIFQLNYTKYLKKNVIIQNCLLHKDLQVWTATFFHKMYGSSLAKVSDRNSFRAN